ncbi:low density lipoprotein receptor adapter protein 1-like [Limulus polyphemus]|uniref:Low density lipoprotein receptor adapter protein 1-like n=1 Tax=Limulus polyphemus TaxID=6850 RepID=A0ABM1TGG4_LIMPO|nr:low density lipoprotein receptor adapter protein 1-like [Limulus polyphemus]
MEPSECETHRFDFNFTHHSRKENASDGTIHRLSRSKSDQNHPRSHKHSAGKKSKSKPIDNVVMNSKGSPSESNNLQESVTGSKNIFDPQTPKLPRAFSVQYLGKRFARGFLGIKNIRQPVDELVADYRTKLPQKSRVILRIEVSLEGIKVSAMSQSSNSNFETKRYPINLISYCAQDTVYDRIFAMIVVQDSKNSLKQRSSECHAFLCEKHHNARELSLSLTTAFHANRRKKEFQQQENDSDA